MYLVNTWITPKDILATGIAKPPFGGGFSLEEVQQADKLELWGTYMEEEGPDSCEYRLIKEDEIISVKEVDGY